jgi:hypothetical protein
MPRQRGLGFMYFVSIKRSAANDGDDNDFVMTLISTMSSAENDDDAPRRHF